MRTGAVIIRLLTLLCCSDLGLLLPIPVSVGTPHVAVEHRGGVGVNNARFIYNICSLGSVRPTSFVSTTRQEGMRICLLTLRFLTAHPDPAGIRREEPSVGQDTSQIPG